MKSPMRFSWKAILLAPAVAPLIAGLVMVLSSTGDPIFNFLFFFAIGCLLSYGASVALFVPSVFVLSRFTRPTAWLTGLVGALLGLGVYLPVAWLSYQTSGDNSGPPQGTFLDYLGRNTSGEIWLFSLGGLVTAIVYCLLSRPGAKR